MPSLAELRKQKLAEQKEEIPADKPKAKTSKKQKEPEDISKLTIDELRAYYIVICKKRPEHNSKQNKKWLINEIISMLNLSK